MSATERKEAIAAYRKRTVDAGVFAVRCGATGAAWIGGWPDVDRVQNRIWFTLTRGAHPRRDLQEAWNAHGSAAFSFEVLERFEPEEDSWLRDQQIKDQVAHWRATLGAGAI